MAETLIFRAHRAQILPALMAVCAAVDVRADVPILQNILLEPDGDALRLRATNMTIEVETTCELMETSRAAAITISGEGLRDIIKNLPESAEITVSLDDVRNSVRISAGKSRFALNWLSPEAFPSIADHAKGEVVEVDMPALVAGLSSVRYAIQDDKVRPYLCGAFIHPFEDGKKIRVVGCDGHNIAIASFAAMDEEVFHPVLMPIKTIDAVGKLFGDVKQPANVLFSDSLIQIRCADICLTSKLVDATFPEYKRTIPESSENLILADVGQLQKAVARVCAVATSEDKSIVRLSCSSGELAVTLHSKSGEYANDSVPANYDGTPIEVGFNSEYLKRMLKSIKSQDVNISLTASNNPGRFTPANGADEIYVVYPMRI
jgi:DNA polymerase III subunit beta